MNDFEKELLDVAVQRERASQELYQKMYDNASSPQLKEFFKRLVAEEMIHEKIFSKRDSEIFKNIRRFNLKPFEVKEFHDLKNYGRNVNELNNALDFAMEREKEAQEFYERIADNTDDQKLKELLKSIAGEERNHEMVLKQTKRELNKIETI